MAPIINGNRLFPDTQVIYPFSYENFLAIIDAYFIKQGITEVGTLPLEKIYERAQSISLGEFQFLAEMVIRNAGIFSKQGTTANQTISNLCQYALDAFWYDNMEGTSPRQKHIKDFRNILINEIESHKQ